MDDTIRLADVAGDLQKLMDEVITPREAYNMRSDGERPPSKNVQNTFGVNVKFRV